MRESESFRKKGPMNSRPAPATMLSDQVPAAKAATAFLGITRAKPQKVKGPPAAAPNSNAAAGALPMPTSSSTATRGISNSRGTLIRMPKVAATTMPETLLPR